MKLGFGKAEWERLKNRKIEDTRDVLSGSAENTYKSFVLRESETTEIDRYLYRACLDARAEILCRVEVASLSRAERFSHFGWRCKKKK